MVIPYTTKPIMNVRIVGTLVGLRTLTSSASTTSCRLANPSGGSCRLSINASRLHTGRSIAAGLAHSYRVSNPCGNSFLGA